MRLAAAVVLGLATLVATGLQATAQQAFPDRSIHVIVGFAAGGPTDVFARVLADRIVSDLGQPVVVENRPGAAGNVAAEYVKNARPDGYTLLFGTASLAIAPALYTKLNYDPVKDLDPIALVGRVPMVLVTRDGMPTTLNELLAFVRASPGKYSYGSAGTGTTTHLAMVLFNTTAGIDLLHVPYRGSAPALQALAAGQHEFALDLLSATKPFVDGGQLHMLAVASERRSGLLPNLPTLKEAGLPGVTGETWNMILAPARTPGPIVQKLNTALRAATSDPAVIGRLTALAIEPISNSTPASSRAYMADEVRRWAPIVKASGARLDN